MRGGLGVKEIRRRGSGGWRRDEARDCLLEKR